MIFPILPTFFPQQLNKNELCIHSYIIFIMSNIKYFGFVKESASVPVFAVILDKAIEQDLKIEVSKVITRLKDLCLVKDERQRIKSQYGCWFCKKDDRGVFYMALCIPTYPQRHIYAAINQVRDHLLKLGEYQNEADATLKLHAKETVNQICLKYDNLKNVDKIGQANRVLDGIKQDIADSTLKLMNNTVNLQSLQRKSQTLKQNAQMFEVSAGQVQREMWCRNCKMKIIIGLVVVALICVIVIPIATTVGKK